MYACICFSDNGYSNHFQRAIAFIKLNNHIISPLNLHIAFLCTKFEDNIYCWINREFTFLLASSS